jgi:hypothetical protein
VEVSNTTHLVIFGAFGVPRLSSECISRTKLCLVGEDQNLLARLAFCVTLHKAYLGRTTANCIFNLPKVAQH